MHSCFLSPLMGDEKSQQAVQGPSSSPSQTQSPGTTVPVRTSRVKAVTNHQGCARQSTVTGEVDGDWFFRSPRIAVLGVCSERLTRHC